MNNSYQSTVGILYPGDLGSIVGKLLSDGGFRVITTLEGRSPRTQRLCLKAGLTVVGSLRDVLSQSDVIISLVIPSAALQVAREVAALANDSARALLYVDANSIPPLIAVEMSEVLRRNGIDFVDAAIHGAASQLQHLRERGILYLSGPRANELASQFGPLVRVKVLGSVPGQASALKMIVSGISKGLIGLFVETMVLARELRLQSDALEDCEHFYPGIMEAVKRMLPTYPQHARRRGEEMREIEQTMLLEGLTPRVFSGAREVISALATLEWARGRDPKQWPLADIIEEVHRTAVLHASPELAAKVRG